MIEETAVKAPALTPEAREKILAATDGQSLVAALDDTMSDVLDFLKSAGVATLFVFEVDDRFQELSYTRINWRAGATLAMGLAERARYALRRAVESDDDEE